MFEIGEKLLKILFSFLAVFKKGWKSNFLEQNTFFSWTILASLANISKRIPNLLGHPVTSKTFNKKWHYSCYLVTLGQYGVPSVPATRPNGVPKTTTFRDMNQGRHRLRLSMTSNESSSSGQSTPRRPSTSSGLVNAASRPNSAQKSRGSQTNHSLFRNYYEKKDKAVYCRDRPQAFFIGNFFHEIYFSV